MDAAPNRIAVVYCAGIAVVAFPWIITANPAIAFIVGTGIAIIAVLGRMYAFSIITGINGAGIMVIAALGAMHACGTIVRVDGTVIAIIAACRCIVAHPFKAVIEGVGFSIIANLRFMLTLIPVKGIHGAWIMIIAAISIAGHECLAGGYCSAVIFAEDAAAIYGLINTNAISAGIESTLISVIAIY